MKFFAPLSALLITLTATSMAFADAPPGCSASLPTGGASAPIFVLSIVALGALVTTRRKSK